MAFETEVKFLLPQPQAMIERLQAAGALLVKARVFESNLRYEDSAGSFSAKGVVLRLRQDDRVRLTYKSPALQTGGVSTRLELETEVADFNVMDTILRYLGYQHALLYEKYRSTYHLLDAELVIDEMPYGTFMEIEGTPEAIEGCILALEFSDQPRIAASYTQLFTRVKAALNLDFRDLSFANFQGIEVPATLFYEERTD